MALDKTQYQKGMDLVYKRYRNKGLTKEQLLFLKDFLDDMGNEFSLIEMREGRKERQNPDKHIESQIKMVKALKMNNPLWDV
ncbi:TPA: hypothetical protein HA234_01140 [Candidatus Woesearchaeota archaeon]|nr:hypothetical protein [Candidatus Woesearchaeota archaeon]HIG92784.1 hypothetical protein [Candidatus Woesearchaeota archaeon]